jgi:hypothetical protein
MDEFLGPLMLSEFDHFSAATYLAASAPESDHSLRERHACVSKPPHLNHRRLK